MSSPFNLPDEFVQGFFKSGQSLWRAMLPGADISPLYFGAMPAETSAPTVGDNGASLAPLAELQLG